MPDYGKIAQYGAEAGAVVATGGVALIPIILGTDWKGDTPRPLIYEHPIDWLKSEADTVEKNIGAVSDAAGKALDGAEKAVQKAEDLISKMITVLPAIAILGGFVLAVAVLPKYGRNREHE